MLLLPGDELIPYLPRQRQHNGRLPSRQRSQGADFADKSKRPSPCTFGHSLRAPNAVWACTRTKMFAKLVVPLALVAVTTLPTAHAIPLSPLHAQHDQHDHEHFYDYHVKSSDHLAALLRQNLTSSTSLGVYDVLPFWTMVGGGCCILVGSVLMLWGLVVMATPACVSTRQGKADLTMFCRPQTTVALPTTSCHDNHASLRRHRAKVKRKAIKGGTRPTRPAAFSCFAERRSNMPKVSLSDDDCNPWRSETSSLSNTDGDSDENDSNHAFLAPLTPQPRSSTWRNHATTSCHDITCVSERGTSASSRRRQQGIWKNNASLSQRGNKQRRRTFRRVQQQKQQQTWQKDNSDQDSESDYEESFSSDHHPCLLLYGNSEYSHANTTNSFPPLPPLATTQSSMPSRKLDV